MQDKSGFVIAAVSSGSGKTTVTNGLLRAIARRGLTAVPFKTGPDFIDTQFHRAAAGRDSVNLDVFMSDEKYVRNLFLKHSEDCDVAIVEGVMGLFDGYDCKKGSAAHIARLTGLPVVLVVNAASSAYSLAAVLSGFKNFDKSISIAGVIFNNVASGNHLRLLKAAAKDAGVEMIGYLERNAGLTVPSRHLGLSTGDESVIGMFVERAAAAVEKTVDIDRLLDLTAGMDCSRGCEVTDSLTGRMQSGKKRMKKIAVASDEAFNFIYPDNLRSLEEDQRFGGEIVRFSPLRDEKMPYADFLYLPGGYPELYATELSANVSMRSSVKNYIECGGYAFAECGGMLYLSENIDGAEMCGVLPLRATMKDARLHLGYRILEINNFVICGHEFHYSSVVEDETRIKDFICGARQFDVEGNPVDTPLYRYKNTLAGYTHFYWGHKELSELFNGCYENLYT